MDPYQERTLEDELHSVMNHFHGLPSEIVEAALKKLTNNKKFGGTKDEQESLRRHHHVRALVQTRHPP